MAYLYIYDCVAARESNARRVSFTKELYGFTYSWKTKSGMKTKRKIGLIEECMGAEPVTDSAILVPDSCKDQFDELFVYYRDILKIKIFKVESEVYL
ncbi:hypothetical protein EU537_01315 [Candidatus Thorarchaeota archaeon]|nr:MAG: hypothetical protein EU537_01315 [Candidatus Thorarchaeota archaeon]